MRVLSLLHRRRIGALARFVVPACAGGALLALLPRVASARDFRVDDIPNGDKVTCLNCHGNLMGTNFTEFGADARDALVNDGNIVQQRHVGWAEICPIDSDRDGWSNGEELGDPNCTWSRGMPDPAVGTVFNPGVKTSHPPPVCGSGKLEAGEDCDGALFDADSCEELGLGTGELACSADCSYDTSGCELDTPPTTSSGGTNDGGGDGGGCSMQTSAHASRSASATGFALLVALVTIGVRRGGARLRAPRSGA